MSDEPQPSASERAVGSERRSNARLRVVPDPDSPRGRAERLANAWTQGAEQADWCVDANVALAGGCMSSDSGVATMPASERRAIHLMRQGMRARAVLAAPEPELEQARRERLRRVTIVIGSVVLHALGFVVLATTVADLQPKSRSGPHEHLFEARAVVPIELPPPAAPSEVEAAPADPVAAPQPKPAQPSPKPSKSSSKSADPKPSEAPPPSPEPYELHGFELSSEGDRPSGDPAAHGRGHDHGHGQGGARAHSQIEQGPAEPAASKPEVQASPRGGLLEPEYPPELERKGIEGSVLLEVWIDEHGHVIKARVVKSSGEEAFDHNALMTAQRQDWSPAMRDGEPIASTRRYRVHFRLR